MSVAADAVRSRRVRLATDAGALLGTALFALSASCGGESATQPGPPGSSAAIGDPLPGLSARQLDQFEVGRVRFRQLFAIETGLGPLFNETGCGACHFVPLAGGSGVAAVFLASAEGADGSCDPLVERGGPIFQRRVAFPIVQAYGFEQEPIPAEATAADEHIAPDLFGFGLLDAVPEQTLVALADPDDSDGDGISGRVGRTTDGRVGRFGRKANVATLAEFVDDAFVLEMGITTPARPQEESPAGLPLPPDADPVPDPEIDAETVRLTDAFIRFLAPPPPMPLGAEGERGRQLFADIGCTACHVPTLRTGANPVEALADRDVAAYSDLLLHDLGAENASVCLGNASAAEFRTEPLMGLRFAQRFMHGGDAGSPEEAIAAHGGEAARTRSAFQALPVEDRNAVLAFLLSL